MFGLSRWLGQPARTSSRPAPRLGLTTLEDRLTPTALNPSFEATPDLQDWTVTAGFYGGTVTVVRGGIASDGNAYARMVLPSTTLNFGRLTGFGATMQSSTFSLAAGQTVGIDISPVERQDDTFAIVKLITAAGAEAAVLYNGSFSDFPGWLTVGAVAPAAGNYYLQVQAGSFDDNGDTVIGAQLLVDNVRTDLTLPLLANVVPVTPQPAFTPVNTVTVNFTQTIVPSSFTNADLKIRNGNGGFTDLGGSGVTITQIDADTYEIGNLASSNPFTGSYELVVDTTGINYVPSADPVAGTGNHWAYWMRATDNTAPTVSSVVRGGSNPTGASSVTYTVTFSESVTGVTANDFDLTATGVTGASVASVSGSGTTYTVTVATGTGDGTLRLDLKSSGTGIEDAAGNDIATGFTGGEAYTIDRLPPFIVSAVRDTSITTPANTVAYLVTFNEAVTGLDVNDFLLATGGSVSGASIVSLSGSGAVYTVLVNVGSGSGTLRLDATLTGVLDPAGNPAMSEVFNGDTINLPLVAQSTGGGQSIFSSVPGNNGAGTSIAIFNPLTGETRQGVVPFTGFNGQLDFTSADFNNDGFADLVVGAGANGGPRVVVLDAVSGAMTASFFAFDERFRGGVEVASGDVTGDGVPDIIVAAGPGGGPHVRVFDGKTFQSVRSFFAFPENVQGGIRLAVADVNGDGKADIVAATGPGGGPQVRVFSGADGTILSSFFAAEQSFTGGVYVAAGDLDGDGKAEVIAGAGAGGQPWLKVFDGNTGTELRSTQPYRSDFRGGVRVLTTDADNDGKADIVVGAGPGGGPHVQTLDGETFQLLNSSYVFGKGLGGGVSIG